MNNGIKNALLLTAGIVIGGTASYFVTKKALEMKFEEDLDAEVQEVKHYYKLLRKEGEFASPETVTPEVNYQELIESYQNSEPLVEEPLITYEEVVEEVEDRDPEVPYVISMEEYMQDREEFDKNTVTYFEEDEVLCDDRETVIPDVEATVGHDSLTKFGTSSSNHNVVYVRNERLEADFEIILDKGAFSEVVLGFKEKEEVRKMRDDE